MTNPNILWRRRFDPPNNQVDYASLVNLPTLGTAAAHADTDFATSGQGAKADTAVQSVPDATTVVKGIVKKAAALSASASSLITDNTGGTPVTTWPAIVGAVYATDAPDIKNAISSIAVGLNALRARVEDMIAKQQTAGQQT